MTIETLKKWFYLGITAIKLRQQPEREYGSGLALLDTSEGTDNLGDFIIMRFCEEALKPLIESEKTLSVPTHCIPSAELLKKLEQCDRKIICGTNILYPQMEYASIWKLPPTAEAYKDCILMGAGWGYYSDKISLYTKIFYRLILNKKYLHAVRDMYTWNKLKHMGIENVVYTGCPTMWGLTPEFCEGIPEKKACYAVTTVTSYEQDRERDGYMIHTLCTCYEKVFVWPQGKDDREYILSLINENEKITVLDRTLKAFEEVLKLSSIDYIGTRLHGGVMALNAGKRSLIIATDNRAEEIGKDTGLPILSRKHLKGALESRIYEDYKTEIHMPFENIELWKKQFI